jgi:hypothetical protein
LVKFASPNTNGAVGWCLEVHDLAVSKLVAGRDKDTEFVSGLLHHHLASRETLRQRIGLIEDPQIRARVHAAYQALMSRISHGFPEQKKRSRMKW